MTLTHMLDWYDGDLLEPTSRAHRSLLSVRLRHCTAARKARKVGFGPITQLDMALTQFGFMGFGVLVPEKLGIHGSPEEQEGFVHFWRTVGFLLGIEDRFNICKENVAETKKVCQIMLEQVFVPALKKPEEGFEVMSHALIEGLWTMVPFLEYDAFLGFTKNLAGIETSNDISSKSLYIRSLLSYQIFVHEILLGYWLFAWLARPVHNFFMWLSVFLTQRMPVLAYLKFGRSQIY
ncbi:hypothetical protein C0J52_22945 [Blattella germanica]|nr:hypothetical protein C0J52_22945 [Blattella germanica]